MNKIINNEYIFYDDNINKPIYGVIKKKNTGTASTHAYYDNTDEEIITITCDKIRIILNKHKDGMFNKTSWLTPFSLIVTMIITFTTTEFKNTFGISSETWKYIYIFFTIIFGLWLIFNVYNIIKYWNKGDIEKIIKDFKGDKLN